jgi:hypothetical protein
MTQGHSAPTRTVLSVNPAMAAGEVRAACGWRITISTVTDYARTPSRGFQRDAALLHLDRLVGSGALSFDFLNVADFKGIRAG